MLLNCGIMRTITIFGRMAAITAAFMLGGCAFELEPGDLGQLQQADLWNGRNNPDRFGGTMVTQLSQLPSVGRAARTPWPSSSWPTYANSIVDRWNRADELSPAEKYDRAFNGWTPAPSFMKLRPFASASCGSEWDIEYYQREQLGLLAKWVSDHIGNRPARDSADNDGDGEVDECDDNDGVETWWGLGHAWVAAAIVEDAPRRSVTYNGVTFHPGDMEALIIAAYDRAAADMIGGDCNQGDEESSPVERDQHGLAIDLECGDINPGSLHIIMSNFLGLQQRVYAEDRTYDDERWSQPVIAYEITRQEAITLRRAKQLLGRSGATYASNADAAQLYDVEVIITYITESYASVTPADPSRYQRTGYYRYILEVASNGEIIGGEWHGTSRTNHPDFLWSPRRITRSAVSQLAVDDLRMLIQRSRESRP